ATDELVEPKREETATAGLERIATQEHTLQSMLTVVLLETGDAGELRGSLLQGLWLLADEMAFFKGQSEELLDPPRQRITSKIAFRECLYFSLGSLNRTDELSALGWLRGRRPLQRLSDHMPWLHRGAEEGRGDVGNRPS